ncbi:ATP-binding cassette domain-containing protein [Dechloromonas denitrificans]|uniref:ATP-binding cassette domain-containing protein n=1 Tax=Azonexaceae TaxID=2008795 RepID=UPI001CF92A9F|nr:ATP-binding cassette domain-containing protein [Dechloromonas denitrificans]UCV03663.1 ATP-binding cassette domain-containing protein [Dechloromonas denitrificans]UCV07923.1 ATP-binding cassette domain-containing protein [Dechloromonas denitrificans]
MATLGVVNLRKTYAGTAVVDGLSFAVEPGTCFGLLGPNGAGKTTTLRLCLGLTAPDSGEITLNNCAIPQDAQRARARVGVVPQFDNLDPDFSASENLLVFGRYFGIPEPEIKARIPQLLDFASLGSKADARISTLSGGMKRRLTLARALVNNPDIIFLDEPTTGLDPQARHLIWDRLKQLKSAGKTLILTTHFMDEAERLCDSLIVIDHGRKIAEGSPRQLIAEQIEPQVIEVYDEAGGDLPGFVEAHRQLAERVESSGETAFFYCRAPHELLARLALASGLRYVHRASNLEDVFIKLTGRELRD